MTPREERSELRLLGGHFKPTPTSLAPPPDKHTLGVSVPSQVAPARQATSFHVDYAAQVAVLSCCSSWKGAFLFFLKGKNVVPKVSGFIRLFEKDRIIEDRNITVSSLKKKFLNEWRDGKVLVKGWSMVGYQVN